MVSYLQGLLADGETAQLVAHRHPLFILTRVVGYLALALALLAVGLWAGQSASWFLGGPVALAALAPAGVAAVRFLAWRGEQYVVTNYRIIQVEGILSKRVFDSSLEKVNDILLHQSLLGRLLDYGTIRIITGSDAGINSLDALRQPFLFKRAIVDARNRLASGEPAPARVPGDRLARLLEALVELRDAGLLSDDEFRRKRDRLVGAELPE